MSFKPPEFDEHCQNILKSRSIRNKVVILCEGTPPSIEGRRSPQSYKKNKDLPDANFYLACVPPLQPLPVFFNCGCNLQRFYVRPSATIDEVSFMYGLPPYFKTKEPLR